MTEPAKSNHQIVNFEQRVLDLVEQQTKQLQSDFATEASLVIAAINERVLTTPHPTNSNGQQTPSINSQPEEMSALLDKVIAISTLPRQSESQEDILYLEQQISDLFNLEVTSQTGDYRLRQIGGKIKSLPHLKSTPTISTTHLKHIPEAGLSSYRSSFGWLHGNQESASFGLAISPTVLDSPLSSQSVKQLQTKLMLVINPYDAKFVIAQITDIFTHSNPNYSWGGSPDLIRQGMFWSPENLGKIIVFFIADDSQQHPLGIVNF